jgi:hypothetical protein
MKLLPLVVGLVAGGLAGWWTGGAPPAAKGPEVAGPNPSASKVRVNVIPPEVQARVKQVRQARGPAERLRQVVILATNLPLADFPRWFEGNYLEFLDGGTEGVFYQILSERWLQAEPVAGARWMLEHDKGDQANAVRAWVRVDESAAVAFVKTLPGARRQQLAGALILAVGDRSVPDALGLLDELRSPAFYQGDLIGKLARQDREAVLDYAAATTGETRRSLLTEVAGAWLEQDLRWVVAMLQREGLGPETFGELANTTGYGSTGLTLLRQAAFLPDGWLEQLSRSERGLLTLGCEIEWLSTRTGKPGLSKKVLQQIQLQAAATPWWYNDKRDAGLKLVEHGDWLPLAARAKIAETLALRWKDDPAAARKWVAGLDGELRAAGEKGLAKLQAEIARTEQAKRLQSPAEVIRALAEETTTGIPRAGADWNAAETADAVRLAGQLAPAKAARVLNSIQDDDDGLPRPVLGAILSRALAEPVPNDESREQQERERTRAACRLAAGWALTEPGRAAAWVETLPPGEARLWAAKNVALQWSHYSTAEARAWAAKLPEGERKAVLATLEKSP